MEILLLSELSESERDLVEKYDAADLWIGDYGLQKITPLGLEFLAMTRKAGVVVPDVMAPTIGCIVWFNHADGALPMIVTDAVGSDVKGIVFEAAVGTWAPDGWRPYGDVYGCWRWPD